MTDYRPHKAQSFCFNNGIEIYPIPKTKKAWLIEVNHNGKIARSKDSYNSKQLTNKIWELYEHFYSKHLNN